MVFHPPASIIAKAGVAGTYKVRLPAWNMLLRGFMAGAYIAMGAALYTVCRTGVAEHFGEGIAAFIGASVFPVGLIIIVLTGAELFTGDAMLAPMAAFIHKVSWRSIAVLWFWVYIGNFLGSVFFAFIMAWGPFITIDPAGAATANVFGMTALSIAGDKVSYVSAAGIFSCFLKAVGCNWLVNLAILLGICADDLVGKFFGIWFPIMAFVALGFEHCVANMYLIPTGLFLQYIDPAAAASVLAGKACGIGGLSFTTMWTSNLVWSTIGNIIGGFVFVGLIYWVAFKDEIAEGQ